MPEPRAVGVGFRAELADFLAFVRRPRLGPRPPRGGHVPYPPREWLGGISAGRLLRWAVVLWGINLLVLGPMAADVADVAGAEYRLPAVQLSWFHVVLWAPAMEEALFRFGLRRPGLGLWLAPFAALGVLFGPRAWVAACVAVGVLFVAWRAARGRRWPWRRLCRYRAAFPFVFHAVTLVFAFLHLANFQLGGGGFLLLPALVLPQWASGLVLGWTRVRFGMGASMALHGLFNAGPMTLLWLAAQYAPDALDAA